MFAFHTSAVALHVSDSHTDPIGGFLVDGSVANSVVNTVVGGLVGGLVGSGSVGGVSSVGLVGSVASLGFVGSVGFLLVLSVGLSLAFVVVLGSVGSGHK